MQYTRLHNTDRGDSEGGMTHGTLMVGDDRIVRWFTWDELSAMSGVGVYSGAHGYNVYDDAVFKPVLSNF